MSQSLILIDALSSACWEKRKKKEREKKKTNGWGAFSPGLDMPCWLWCMGFSQLLGTIKG
jgi:hypothetical protein